MARHYCSECGQPLPRRARVCVACEAEVREIETPEPRRTPRSWTHRCAIGCVALSCLGFVTTLGTTSLLREGGWVQGGLFFAAILFSVRWVNQLEHDDSTPDETDSTAL